jgi:hypothetical protein
VGRRSCAKSVSFGSPGAESVPARDADGEAREIYLSAVSQFAGIRRMGTRPLQPHLPRGGSRVALQIMKSLLGLLTAAWLMPLVGFAASREVVVYSFLTDAGRDFGRTISNRPLRGRLGSGGYHEWGAVRAGEKPVTLEQIEPWIHLALQVNAIEPLRAGEAADIVVIFHWGCMRPDAGWPRKGRFDAVVNQLDMLDLVGGRALENTSSRILRQAIIEAASEERYFLIVSAFEPTSYARNTNLLLWRTQVSLPSPGISQLDSFSILAAAGAALYGREMDGPRFVSIDVEKALRITAQATRP